MSERDPDRSPTRGRDGSRDQAGPLEGGVDDGSEESEDLREDPDIDDLLDELEELEATVDEPDEREQVRATIRVARRVGTDGVFGRVVRGYDAADVAEAFVGALVFGIPMTVEGGTQEVGGHLAAHPPLLVGTAGFGVAITLGILYVAEFQDVRVYRPLFGFLPRRLVGVVGIAFGLATAMLTAWGRVDWSEPTVALGQVVVAFVPMVVGASLGDILPGS